MGDLTSEGEEHFAEPGIFKGISEQVKEGTGVWRSCSGCYEIEDGYPVGHYRHSRAFNCALGAGCSECGGLGAVWDTTDYADMARFMAEEDASKAKAKEERDALQKALSQAHGAIYEFYRYSTGGETRGSYDGKPEREGLWKAMYAARAALTAEQMPCEHCQGNGEIVTDWDRYRHPLPSDAGDEAVTKCPDCSGTGLAALAEEERR